MDTHRVHLEPLGPRSYLARLGDSSWAFGQPYQDICVVTELEPGTAEIKGVSTRPTRAKWDALVAALKEHGFTKMVFDRIKDGIERRRVHKL